MYIVSCLKFTLCEENETAMSRQSYLLETMQGTLLKASPLIDIIKNDP